MTDRKKCAKRKVGRKSMVDVVISGIIGFLLGNLVGLIITTVLIGDKKENDI